MLKLHNNFPHEIVPIQDFPYYAYNGFSCICDGRLIFGLEKWNGLDITNIFEYEGGWKQLPQYTEHLGRRKAAAYIENHLVLCGGFNPDDTYDNRVHILRIDANSYSSQWAVCYSPLPARVFAHQLTLFRGKLILTGGIYAHSDRNWVWEGTFHEVGPNITWKKLPSMRRARSSHFAFPFENKLYVLGSDREENATSEYFNGETWKMGLDMRYSLRLATATIDKTGRTILIGGIEHYDLTRSGRSNIISFHPTKGFQNIETVELPEARHSHVALLS